MGNADDADMTTPSAFIIDEPLRWWTVRPLQKGRSGEEEEEIANRENYDPVRGRMGSVCDVMRPQQGDSVQTATSSNKKASPMDASRAGRSRDAQQKRHQLDDLLRRPIPCAVQNATEYAGLRARYALLRAFERRLLILYRTALDKCRNAADEVRSLDDRHPEHRTAFRAHYEKALRESGFSIDSVPFARFLED